MPRRRLTDEEIRSAWERKRERDRKAQAKWVSENREVHLERMREQYLKKKAVGNKEEAPQDAPAVPSTTGDRIREYKQNNPSASQRVIAQALGVSQSSVSRSLKKQ